MDEAGDNPNEAMRKAMREALEKNYRQSASDPENYEYTVSMKSFLDQAYKAPNGVPRQKNGSRYPLSGPPGGVPEHKIENYLKYVRAALKFFGEEAFAIIMNPVDYAKMEMLNFELNGAAEVLGRTNDEALLFSGVLCQQAAFTPEGCYAIVDEADYQRLLAVNDGA